jgi:hypothetical protein
VIWRIWFELSETIPMRKDITEQKDWVVVETPNLVPHYFTTFNEALSSPIKGHLMSEEYYRCHYEQLR